MGFKRTGVLLLVLALAVSLCGCSITLAQPNCPVIPTNQTKTLLFENDDISISYAGCTKNTGVFSDECPYQIVFNVINKTKSQANFGLTSCSFGDNNAELVTGYNPIAPHSAATVGIGASLKASEHAKMSGRLLYYLNRDDGTFSSEDFQYYTFTDIQLP